MILLTKKEDIEKIKYLFKDIRYHMGNSVLDGCMGNCYTDNLENPKFAMLILRAYCYISGEISKEEFMNIFNEFKLEEKVIIPSDDLKDIIKQNFNNYKITKRYSIKKNPEFKIEKLKENINKMDSSKYTIKKIDVQLANRIKQEEFMKITDDYENFGIGFCCFYGDQIVGVASSNIFYENGIEVNIKVHPEHRRNNIALALASSLILECTSKNKQISWDAAHLGSVKLAEKLGFEFDSEYECFDFLNYNKNDIKKEIQEIIDKYKVRGASIAIIDEYEIKFYDTFGECESEIKKPVTKDTLFQVGSISKTVFATAIMNMYQNNILDINKQINDVLKNYKLEIMTEREVSIKDLLSNSEKICCETGQNKYLDRGYTILQYMIEDMFLNNSFQDIMDKYLFSILGMQHSKYYENIKKDDNIASDKYYIYPEYAVAGLYSTAYDIALMGMNIQKSLIGYGFLNKDIAENMLKRVNNNPHGIGFRISDDNKNFWNEGINNGYKSHSFFTKDGKGIVILTNDSNEEVFDELENYIKEKYEWCDTKINSFKEK